MAHAQRQSNVLPQAAGYIVYSRSTSYKKKFCSRKVAAGRRRTLNLTHRVDSGSLSIVAIRNGGGVARTIGAIVRFQRVGIPMVHIQCFKICI